MWNAGTRVGPVLLAGTAAEAVVAAIRVDNAEVEVEVRGSQLRVLAPGRCVLVRARVEAALGREFHLPEDLEAIMPSFSGRLRMTAQTAEWI